MHQSAGTPSIVPGEGGQTVYLVLDDRGPRGRAWREADFDRADLEAVINDLLAGQYEHPSAVIAFNVAEGWANDASPEVAREVRRRCDLQFRDVPFFLQDFVDRFEGRFHDYQLPLPMRLA
jgi:hypothetical protein